MWKYFREALVIAGFIGIITVVGGICFVIFRII
jgi:hypothetical protein